MVGQSVFDFPRKTAKTLMLTVTVQKRWPAFCLVQALEMDQDVGIPDKCERCVEARRWGKGLEKYNYLEMSGTSW